MPKGIKGFQKGHKRAAWNKGKHMKHAGSFKKGHKDFTNGATTGKNHHLWKGKNVSYSALHKWISRQLGKPKHCAHCQTTTAKKFEWANLSHSYKRDLSDWIRLCTKCHIGYDKGQIAL